MNLLLLSLTTLFVFTMERMGHGEERKKREALHWKVFCPIVSVESSKVKCQMKCARVCRKTLDNALVRKCRDLKMGCIYAYFGFTRNYEKCEIKCEITDFEP